MGFSSPVTPQQITAALAPGSSVTTAPGSVAATDPASTEGVITSRIQVGTNGANTGTSWGAVQLAAASPTRRRLLVNCALPNGKEAFTRLDQNFVAVAAGINVIMPSVDLVAQSLDHLSGLIYHSTSTNYTVMVQLSADLVNWFNSAYIINSNMQNYFRTFTFTGLRGLQYARIVFIDNSAIAGLLYCALMDASQSSLVAPPIAPYLAIGPTAASVTGGSPSGLAPGEALGQGLDLGAWRGELWGYAPGMRCTIVLVRDFTA